VDKVKKTEVVEQLKGIFGSSQIVIVSHNKGLTVSQDAKLRREIKKSRSSYRVAKNTLARIAIKDTSFSSLDNLFTGPTSIAYSEDAVGVAKALVDFSKEHAKLEILGAVMDGKVLDVNSVKALATLPSLDQLRSTIIGLVQAPASKLARVTQAPAAQLARVFQAYADKK